MDRRIYWVVENIFSDDQIQQVEFKISQMLRGKKISPLMIRVKEFHPLTQPNLVTITAWNHADCVMVDHIKV